MARSGNLASTQILPRASSAINLRKGSGAVLAGIARPREKEVSMPTLVGAPVRTTVFLTPERVAKMLLERRSFQIVKFRTNCSDCVPNL